MHFLQNINVSINSTYEMKTVKSYIHIPLFGIGPYIKFLSSGILYILDDYKKKSVKFLVLLIMH